MSKEKDLDDGLKELIIARLDIMPPNFKLSIGDFGTFTKQEMIENVRKENEIGKQIVQMQVNFINALTSGKFTEALNQ